MGRARHWPDLIERRSKRDQAVSRHTPIGRLQAGNAAERRRLPDGSAGIRSKRDRRHACRHCDGRSATRPAGDVIGIPGIARRPERRVLGRRAHGEFIAIRLAHHDGARRLESRHHRCVVGWNEPLKHSRRSRRRDAASHDVVFERDRDAGQRSRVVVAIDRPGTVERTFARDGQERAQPGVGRIDSCERLLADLDGGDCSVRRSHPGFPGPSGRGVSQYPWHAEETRLRRWIGRIGQCFGIGQPGPRLVGPIGRHAREHLRGRWHAGGIYLLNLLRVSSTCES